MAKPEKSHKHSYHHNKRECEACNGWHLDRLSDDNKLVYHDLKCNSCGKHMSYSEEYNDS